MYIYIYTHNTGAHLPRRPRARADGPQAVLRVITNDY